MAARADDDSTWLTASAVPVYITEGPYADHGIADLQIAYLSQHLTDHRYHIVRADSARAWYQMEHGDGFCFHGVPRTPQHAGKLAFSQRAIVVPSYRLVTYQRFAEDLHGDLTASGEIDLEQLAQQDGLIGGYIAGRSYFGPIERFITDGARHIKLEKLPQARQVFNLFTAGRLDFVLATALETRFFAQATKVDEPLMVLPIKGIPLRLSTYTACSDTPRGRAMIAEIDGLLKDDGRWAEFMAPAQEWMDPVDFQAALSGK